MDDVVDAVDGAPHGTHIAQIALNEIDLVASGAQIRQIAARQVIEDANVLAARQQRFDNVRSNEPCSTCD